MATKNSTLPVTTLLTVLKREIELQKTFCFKQDGKSQATHRANLAEITSWPITAC